MEQTIRLVEEKVRDQRNKISGLEWQKTDKLNGALDLQNQINAEQGTSKTIEAELRALYKAYPNIEKGNIEATSNGGSFLAAKSAKPKHYQNDEDLD